MPAVTDICDQVIAVINAASLAGDFPVPLKAIDKNALTLPMEDSDRTKIFVQPGPCSRETGTLDGGVSETSSVRLVFEASPVTPDSAAVNRYLNLVQLVCDKLEEDIGQSYIYLGAEHDGNQLYDQDRLRNDAVFYSELTVQFSSLRYTA